MQVLTTEAIETILDNAHLAGDRQAMIHTLKYVRENYGVDIGVKLNRKTSEILAAWHVLVELAQYQHDQDIRIEEALEEANQLFEVQEQELLTNEEFSNFDGIDTQTMMACEYGWIAAYPLTCDVCCYQYCEIPQPQYSAVEAIASVADVVKCLRNRMFKDAKQLWALIPASWVNTCSQLLKSYKIELQKQCHSFKEMVKINKAIDAIATV